ncbi:hypothetical protein HALA3H3_170005 [Halomonas sp. A3H3]|nr:hypothetical protein HALA3H3_170005 [Halomonas sp. A3H3]
MPGGVRGQGRRLPFLLDTSGYGFIITRHQLLAILDIFLIIMSLKFANQIKLGYF